MPVAFVWSLHFECDAKGTLNIAAQIHRANPVRANKWEEVLAEDVRSVPDVAWLRGGRFGETGSADQRQWYGEQRH